jgi:hypothetical protein
MLRVALLGDQRPGSRQSKPTPRACVRQAKLNIAAANPSAKYNGSYYTEVTAKSLAQARVGAISSLN